jgi:amino acid permease
MVKGIWAIIFTIPVLVLVCFYHNPQVLVVYTGGICGTFILFIFPVTMVIFARRFENKRDGEEELNFHRSPFQHNAWLVGILLFACVTLYFVILGIIAGNAGH